jgi:heme-degrading monooxygenase HmoA
MEGQLITTGTWMVDEGKQPAFIEAWAAFAASASTSDGATMLRLGRDASDPRRFVSFATWTDEESVRAWKSSPDQREGLAHVLQHVDDFHSEELEVLVSAAGGRTAIPVAD